MKPENSIEVHNVSKAFKVYLDKGSTMKERVIFKNRRKFENRQVLDNISFDIKKGEAVGLIGHNGCGKSTTLKLLTKIMYPDSGSIEMRGRISSLIELGAGFHPDMSGRENIYINASIFGLTKKEIDDRLEDIIAFSELEEFIENPVRTYSSGMYMRLAFAVAINVNADILLIDEILAVGDASFQAKCFNKMREIKASGTTIVLVSHSMGQVEQLCDRAIWIHQGIIREEGNPKDVTLEYLQYMSRERLRRAGAAEIGQAETENGNEEPGEKAELKPEEEDKNSQTVHEENPGKETEVSLEEKPETEKLPAEKLRYGDGRAEITEVKLLNADGIECKILDTEDACRIVVNYNVKQSVPDVQFGIGIFRIDGMSCYGTNTGIDHVKTLCLDRNGKYEFEIRRLGLLPGVYWIDVAIEAEGGMPVDYYKKVIRFEVISNVGDIGISRIPHKWRISGQEEQSKAEENN